MSATPPLVEIPDSLYADLATELLAGIGGANYFNGRVGIDADKAHCQLIATLLVYRDGPRIRDIVPVWWEFRMLTADEQADTDFDWAELRQYLI